MENLNVVDDYIIIEHDFNKQTDYDINDIFIDASQLVPCSDAIVKMNIDIKSQQNTDLKLNDNELPPLEPIIYELKQAPLECVVVVDETSKKIDYDDNYCNTELYNPVPSLSQYQTHIYIFLGLYGSMIFGTCVYYFLL